MTRLGWLVVIGAAACGAHAAPPVAPAQPGTPMPELRLTPDQLAPVPADDNQIGSSGLPGVHTRVVLGDPSQPGLYAILLFVPPDTSIAAHSHRDDRVATVLSGTWRFGYGDMFDPAALAVLPPGSVYAEPGTAAHNHFAQTQAEPVVVLITGFGPTDTVYVNPADDPSHQAR